MPAPGRAPQAGLVPDFVGTGSPRTRTRSCAAPTTRRPSRRARRGPRPNAPMRRLRQRDGAIPPSASPTPSFRNPGAGIRTKPARSASTTAATAAHRPTHDRGQDRRLAPAPGRAPLAGLVPDFVGTGSPRTRTRSCTAPTTGPASRRARQRQAPASPTEPFETRRFQGSRRAPPGHEAAGSPGRVCDIFARSTRRTRLSPCTARSLRHVLPAYYAIRPCTTRNLPAYYAGSRCTTPVSPAKR